MPLAKIPSCQWQQEEVLDYWKDDTMRDKVSDITPNIFAS